MTALCGVYFCLKGGKIVYIGKTTNVLNRVEGHRCTGLHWEYDIIRFITCPQNKLDYYEQRWIKRFQPSENRAWVKPKKVKLKLGPTYKKKLHMKFRVMTFKSVIGYGNFRDWTVQSMIDRGKIISAIDFYFNLSHISFHEDVLNFLKIIPEWRIEKPGTDPDKGVEFKRLFYEQECEDRERRENIRLNSHARKVLKNDNIRSNNKDLLRQKNLRRA